MYFTGLKRNIKLLMRIFSKVKIFFLFFAIENAEMSYYKNLSQCSNYILNFFTGLIPQELVVELYFKRQVPEEVPQTDDKNVPYDDIYFRPELKNIIYIDKSVRINKLFKNSDLVELSAYKFSKLSSLRLYTNIFNVDKSKVVQGIKIIPPKENKSSQLGDSVSFGQFGNSNLYKCLKVLLNKNITIDYFFETKELTKDKLYEVRLVIQGKVKLVVIDENIPCTKGINGFLVPAFISSKDEARISLIEKAFAKINRSYANTLRSLCSEIFPFLTEAPMSQFVHSRVTKNKLWETVFIAFLRNSVIFSEFEAMTLEQYSPENFISYFVDNIVTLEGDRRYLDLSFAETDAKLVKNIKEIFDEDIPKDDLSEIEKNSNRGNSNRNSNTTKKINILISFDKFYLTFYKTCTVFVNPDYYYSYKKLKSNPTRYNLVKFNVTKDTKVYLTLHLKDTRFNIKQTNYDVPVSRLTLMKLKSHDKLQSYYASLQDSTSQITGSKFYTNKNNKKSSKCLDDLEFEYVDSVYGKNEKQIIMASLIPGEYYAMYKVYYNRESVQNVVLSTYSDVPVEFLDEIDQNLVDKSGNFINNYCLNSLFHSYLENVSSTIINNDKEMVSYMSLTEDKKFGYSIMKYENKSKNKVLNIRINYSCEGMTLITDDIFTKEFKTLGAFGIDSNSQLLKDFNLTLYPQNKNIVVFEWEKNFNEISINIKQNYKIEIPLFSFDRKMFPNLNKNFISKNIFYYEVQYVEGVYIVVVNESIKNFNLKVSFVLKNLFIDSPSSENDSLMLNLPKESKGIINLKFLEQERTDVSYKMTFKLKERLDSKATGD